MPGSLLSEQSDAFTQIQGVKMNRSSSPTAFALWSSTGVLQNAGRMTDAGHPEADEITIVAEEYFGDPREK